MVAFKLLALDLDGTLLPFDGDISDRTQQAVERARRAGIIVTLASGRPFHALLPYVEKLAISAPIICNQGCRIVRPHNGEVVYDATIPLARARMLLAYLQPRGLDVLVDVNDEAHIRPVKFSDEFYQDFIRRPYTRVKDLSAGLHDEPAKVLIMDSEQENAGLLAELRERFGHLIRFLRSHPMFIEAIPLGEDKGSALQRVAGELGIPRELTMAVGDAENDIEMLAWAGLGVAMGNASPSVKAVADYVAPNAEDDGAAQAIEKFCLN